MARFRHTEEFQREAHQPPLPVLVLRAPDRDEHSVGAVPLSRPTLLRESAFQSLFFKMSWHCISFCCQQVTGRKQFGLEMWNGLAQQYSQLLLLSRGADASSVLHKIGPFLTGEQGADGWAEPGIPKSNCSSDKWHCLICEMKIILACRALELYSGSAPAPGKNLQLHCSGAALHSAPKPCLPASYGCCENNICTMLWRGKESTAV